ncbi:MAG: Ig-like domain repeat protein, partial [Terriglobales bacterium]
MRNARRIRPVFFVSIFALLLAVSQGMFASGNAASVPDRITQQIDENNLVKLAGNTRPEANFRNDRGAVSDGFAIEHMFLQLQRSPAKEQELDKLIDELNDKTSPNFHHWLTAEKFGQRFGVAQKDIDTITSWLQSHGFRVNRVYPSRMLIDFSGTAGQIQGAFHTEIHQLEVNGEQHISNMSDPQIPEALAPVVKGIVSLNDFKPHPMYRSKTQYTVAGCADTTFPTEPGTDCYFITPQDTETIYDLNPLYAAGISGQGQTIALVEDTDTYTPTGGTFASDWNTYRSTFGLSENFPLGTYTEAHPGCTDPGSNGDDGEAAIDVEVASAVAPSAAIELISCASSTFSFGGQIALQNLVNESGPYPGVVSVSYGICEAFNGAGMNAAFYNTYQQAASEGISVFVSSGDEGPSSCSNLFSVGSEYDVASLGVTGWGETPYNVSVGGTDFEDTYNVKEAGASFSTYWSATNSQYYGSALQYVPEIPWNDACASVLISDVLTNSFTTYGTSGTCNNSSWDTSSTYLSTGAGSGGASNCATGAGGADQSSDALSDPECQGYAKPSWQSGASLAGSQAVYGQPSDGVRDIPDVSMFAANGVWGHYEVICWSDPAYSSDGSAPCTGAPSAWAGFGGTSVASPTMAAIQALVNQKTGQNWGNPNPVYYQIAQNEYGVAGGTFLGGSCNSSASGGPASGCVFNDITQGDINLACEDNGTLEEAHCYKPSGTYGVDSSDNVTAATVINGGTGYTAAPTCAIAGPTNNSPYVTPTGTTLWAGGTQAACTASVSSSSTTAVWSIAIESSAVAGQTLTFTDNNGDVLATYTLTGTSTTSIASNLVTSINGSTFATATSSRGTVTATAKTSGYAGNFYVSWGTGFLYGPDYIRISQTTAGQGPNYVSGITITTAGSGYQPETPVTLTGVGSGAIAVANTSVGTSSQSYQPAYGAAPGYDLATGLGSVNAYNLVCSNTWSPEVCTATAISSSLNPSTYGQAVSFTATVTGNSPTGTVQFTVDGSNLGSPVALSSGSATSVTTSTLAVGTHTVTAMYSGDSNNSFSTGTLSGGQVVGSATSGTVVTSSGSPSAYGQSVTLTATINGEYGLLKNRKKGPKAQDVSGTVTWSANTGCGTTPVTTGNPGTATCTTSSLAVGTDTITATYSGDSNHSGSTGTLNQAVNQATTSLSVTSVNPASEDYGADQQITITAVLSWTGSGAAPTASAVTIGGNGPSGTYGTTTCGAPSGDAITCTNTYTPTAADMPGSYTESATFAGDSNYSASSSPQTNNFTITSATSSTSVTSSLNPSTYGQSVTFTATINGEYGLLKGRQKVAKRQD